eukprot:s1878_g14.t1
MREECDAQGRVYVAFSSLAMGDSGACEYTQCSHLGVCLQGGVLSPGELLVHAAAPPRGLLSVGLVIDDLVCLDQVLTSDLAAIHAGKAAPLEVSPDKVFRDQVKASFWGATVCGASGWLKPNAHRLWPLVFITLRTIELGLATRHLLESLAGCWISVFVLKRRFLAAMDLIFKACCAGSPNTILRLSPALRAELASFVVLGPLCSVNLRAQIDPTVSATDASSGWQAAVRAEIPVSVAQEAYRHSAQKGAWTRLLSAPGAWLKEHGLLNVESELPGGEVFSALPLYLGLATCPKYTELWRKRYKSRVHINVAELQAFLREEARAGHRKPDSRMIFGLDSQVCIGALAKGRSASPKLNQLLCRSIPAVAGSQIQSVPIYFPSAFNPADDPTRDREVRPPAQDPPPWWRELCAGNPGPLEKATEEAGFGRDGEAFDQSQLFTLCAPVLASASSLRRESLRAARAKGAKWQRSPQRDICSPAAAHTCVELRPEARASLEAFPARFFHSRTPVPDLCRAGALCLWPGRGNMVRELLRLGCPWVLALEPSRSAAEDLHSEGLRRRLRDLVAAAAFSAVFATPAGSSFSRARLPSLRSPSALLGFPCAAAWVQEKVRRETILCEWLADLKVLCVQAGIGYAFECPDASWWWRMPGWEDERSPSGGRGPVWLPTQLYAEPACSAPHPGPQGPQPRDPLLDLEARPLYSDTSSFLGQRAWASFLAWCSLSLSFDPLPTFHSCPPLLAMALRAFGNFLYRTGGSLQTYRYAIVAGQRLNWCMRGQLGPAWELVSR